MEDVVFLEWNFTPKDYFEDEIRIVRKDYEMLIMEGKVEVRINPKFHNNAHKIRDDLHQRLNAMFLGVQLKTHKPYDLPKSTICSLYPDGRKHFKIFIEDCTKVGENLDLVQKDENGIVIYDSRRDRIEKKKKLAESAEKYSSDPVATFLLASYNSAVNDPGNELVRLYEIRDALSKKFGGNTQACKALGLSASEWSRLGQLANNEPLRQGRHRGKSAGELRNAREDEIVEARKIARRFVEAYFVHLDRPLSKCLR